MGEAQAATIAAVPPLEPPTVLVTSYGLLVLVKQKEEKRREDQMT